MSYAAVFYDRLQIVSGCYQLRGICQEDQGDFEGWQAFGEEG